MHQKIRPSTRATDATLSCELRQITGGFEIAYTVHETSARAAYVLDVQSNYKDPPVRIDTPMYLAINDGGIMRVVQGLVPLPPDREVAVRFIPLAAKLAPNASLARVLRIGLPVREQGPYDPPDPSFKTRGVSVTKLLLDVHLLRPTARAFTAVGDRDPDDSFSVRAYDLDGAVRRVSCELEIPPTIVYYAPRGFTRVDDSAPAASPHPSTPAPAQPVTPVTPVTPGSLEPAPIAQGASLTCEVKSRGDRLELTYTVREESGAEVYALDLLHDEARPGNRTQTPIYLARTAGGARVIQGIAPLPSDRQVEQRIIPLASRIAPKGKVTRVLSIPSPMHETGPYDPLAPAISTAPADVERLVLDVHLIRPTVREFTRAESTQIKGAFVVHAFDTVGSAERVTCEVAIPPSTVYRIPRGFVRVQ